MSFSENSSDSDWKEAKLKVKLNESGNAGNNNAAATGRQKYSQKFCEKWLSLFDPWLRRSAEDPNKPFCRACQCRLDCNRCHLVRHERTTKHKRNLESLVTKGEGAVRKELSVRQERSKYYHQRKRALKHLKQELQPAIEEQHNQLQDLAASAINTEINSENAIEDSSHNFPVQVIEATATNTTQIQSQSPLLTTTGTGTGTTTATPVLNNSRIPSSQKSPRSTNNRKEGLKLLMQIQQDKNELMESFRELIGVQLPHVPPREKNHVDLFFESVSSSVKALSPKLVAEAKMRVSQLICELELRALKDNGANGGDPVAVENSAEQHCISQHTQFAALT